MNNYNLSSLGVSEVGKINARYLNVQIEWSPNIFISELSKQLPQENAENNLS